MTLQLADLGEDIIASNIALHLSADDIFSFSLTNKLFRRFLTNNNVYHLLYLKKFGSTKPTPLNLDEYDWRSLFNLRASPQVNLYTWGSSGLGRLGYLMRDIPADHVSVGGITKNVHTPTNVKNFNDFIISDVDAGGFSFQILMNDGGLYYTGVRWTRNGGTSVSTPGPRGKDYTPPFTYAQSHTPITPMPFIGSVSSRRSIQRPQPASSANDNNNTNGPAAPSPAHRPRATPTRGVPAMPSPSSSTLESGDRDRGNNIGGADLNSRLPTNPNLTRPPEQLVFPPELTQAPASGQTTSGSPKTDRKSVEPTNFITRAHLPPSSLAKGSKIVAISSGREHFIALDQYSTVYTWDTGNHNDVGVKIEFDNLPRTRIANTPPLIKKISAGWNLSACYMHGVGILVWYSRESVSKDSYDNGSMVSKAHYVVVPDTSNGNDIVDLVALCDFILYIKSDGKLYRFDLWAEGYASSQVDPMTLNQPYEVSGFNRWLAVHNNTATGGVQAQFSKLSGCYNNFAVFTDHGSVLLGNKDSAVFVDPEGFSHYRENDEASQALIEAEWEPYGPKIIDELQNKHIIHVETGDYHYMALTDTGELITWGRESDRCGCLGLGSKDHFVNTRGSDAGVDASSPTLSISKPATVGKPFEGKWLAIAAAGWHSAGLFVPS